MATLSHHGLIIPDSLLKNILKTNYDKFFDNLTIRYEPKKGRPIITRLYSTKFVGKKYYTCLPRVYLSKFKKYMPITVDLPVLIPLGELQMKIDLYPDQQHIVETLLQRNFTEKAIKEGEGCALLNLGAGKGKTMVAAGLINALKVKTIYIVPKVPLLDQAVSDLNVCLDGVSIAKYTPSFAKKIANGKATLPDILVIVINSAIIHKELFKSYSFVIFDEVHQYCSKKRREIFKIAMNPICLGMSATTNQRKEGDDKISHGELAFGGILYAAELLKDFEVEEAPQFDCDVEIINYYGSDDFSKTLKHEATGEIFCHYMHQQACADPHRLQLALNEISKLYDWRGGDGGYPPKQHLIYVFAEELAPLRTMYEILRAKYGDELAAPEFRSLVGGAKSDVLAEIRKNARIILTTYGYSGTGMSINHASAIIFLTTRKAQMEQILARILRRGSDMSIRRQVRDIVDTRTPLRHQVKVRKEAYAFYKMNVIEKNISYSNIVVSDIVSKIAEITVDDEKNNEEYKENEEEIEEEFEFEEEIEEELEEELEEI
jgi:superfamily II DNA or RNA helicase